MGLPAVDDAGLARLTREIKVDGKAVTLVDLKAETARPAVKAPEPAPQEAPDGMPTYTVPQGWQKSAKPVTFSIATFDAGDGDRKAVVSVSPLAGGAGGLTRNVNRWREQVGLKAAGDDEIEKAAKDFEVGGAAGRYVDLVGPESAGSKRLLAVVVSRGAQTWFFKMLGPADVVEKQKPAFEAFLKSVRFGGPGGGKP
jgi:hypothetical protein